MVASRYEDIEFTPLYIGDLHCIVKVGDEYRHYDEYGVLEYSTIHSPGYTAFTSTVSNEKNFQLCKALECGPRAWQEKRRPPIQEGFLRKLFGKIFSR